ncbi:MAG: hypothetical protein GY799_21280 [Desulfobulbaceae bacterium]|nr:hypothetical protein [Desulfobulbaceae bacterium]
MTSIKVSFHLQINIGASARIELFVNHPEYLTTTDLQSATGIPRHGRE